MTPGGKLAAVAGGFVALIGATLGIALAVRGSGGGGAGAHYANQPFFSGLTLAQQAKFQADLFAQYTWLAGGGNPSARWQGAPIASAASLADAGTLGEAAANFASSMMTSPSADNLNGVVDANMMSQAAQDK
jgi:hypothetical protein